VARDIISTKSLYIHVIGYNLSGLIWFNQGSKTDTIILMQLHAREKNHASFYLGSGCHLYRNDSIEILDLVMWKYGLAVKNYIASHMNGKGFYISIEDALLQYEK